MEQYKQQIARVWQETLTAEEKKQLLTSFLQHEVDWKITLEKEYWQDLQAGTQYWSQERAEQVLAQLHGQILADARMQETPRKGRVLRIGSIVKWTAAAAAVVVLFLGYYGYRQPAPPTAVAKTAAPAGSTLRTQTNTGQADRAIQLADGSLVTLSPNSSIRYYEPFVGTRRDISLSGQATFTVAHDTSRPFTVYAGDVATTALGTQFIVNTLVKDRVQVKLLEGKVVVRPASQAFAMKDVLLRPGEEFNMDRVLHQFTVTRFREEPVSGAVLAQEKEKPKEKNVLPVLEFTQEPLTLVLAAIGKRYNVQFTYQEDEISNEQVTGKFLASDSLSTVLSILSTVNRLTFTRHDSTIAVIKTQ